MTQGNSWSRLIDAMPYLADPDLTEAELVWIDGEIKAGRFASRTDAILRLLGRGLESDPMIASYINDPKHWQDRAAEMRARAAGISSDEDGATMLRLAKDYDKLAMRAAKRAGGTTP